MTVEGTPTTVYSEVEAGVWRIAPVPVAQRPAIRLLSPLIGEDSALFDRITLRLLIIHDRPTWGNLLMNWSNVESRRRKQEAGTRGVGSNSGFYTGRLQLYPTEWENITIDIRGLEAGAEARRDEPIATIWADTEITWQDTLFHLKLELDLNRNPRGRADHPAFVEVDWIQLTGAEELLLGELPPREIAEAGLPARCSPNRVFLCWVRVSVAYFRKVLWAMSTAMGMPTWWWSGDTTRSSK